LQGSLVPDPQGFPTDNETSSPSPTPNNEKLESLDEEENDFAMTSEEGTSTQKIQLILQDGTVVFVRKSALSQSGLLATLMDNDPKESRIPLEAVPVRLVEKCMAYMEYHESPDHVPRPILLPLRSKDWRRLFMPWDVQFLYDTIGRERRFRSVANRMQIEEEDSKDVFVPNNVHMEALLELMLVANYMEIKSLVFLISAAIGCWLQGLSTEEIRTRFKIKNDFTPEEEATRKMQTEWLRNVLL